MPPQTVIGCYEVNRVSQRPTDELQQILRKYDFVSLPTRGNSIQLAVRNNDKQGVVYCDVLIYQEINGAGKALREEATTLVDTISYLQTTLPCNPQSLHSTFQSHAISFFGKKAHVLTTKTGQALCCQMTALLISRSDDFIPSIKDRVTASPAHIIHYSQLEDFLNQNLPKGASHQNKPSASIDHLQASYRLLGLTFLLIPFIIGLTGVCISIGSLLLALLASLLGVLGSVFLIRKALGAFNQFQLNNSIPVQTVQPLVVRDSQPLQAESDLELPSLQDILQPVSPPATLWLPGVSPTRSSKRRKVKSAVIKQQG